MNGSIERDLTTVARGAAVFETSVAFAIAGGAILTGLVAGLALFFTALCARLVLAQISEALQQTQEPVAILATQLIVQRTDRKSKRMNSTHIVHSYAVLCL